MLSYGCTTRQKSTQKENIFFFSYFFFFFFFFIVETCIPFNKIMFRWRLKSKAEAITQRRDIMSSIESQLRPPLPPPLCLGWFTLCHYRQNNTFTMEWLTSNLHTLANKWRAGREPESGLKSFSLRQNPSKKSKQLWALCSGEARCSPVSDRWLTASSSAVSNTSF